MMHADYVNPVIRELRDQQVRFAPREKKLEQVNRAEKLLAELDPGDALKVAKFMPAGSTKSR